MSRRRRIYSIQVTIEVVLDGEMMGADKEVNRKVDGEVDELLEVV